MDAKKRYTIHVRVQPFIYDWLKNMEREGSYGNMSDIVRTAIYEFKTQIQKEKDEGERNAKRITEILGE